MDHTRTDLERALLVVTMTASYLVKSSRRRDRREPGRLEKVALEERMARLFSRRFRDQERALKERLSTYFPGRKASYTSPIPLDDLFRQDDEWVASLVRLLRDAATHGLRMFAEGSAVQMDWAMTNARAADWARRYGYDLVKSVDQTTRQILQFAVSQFVDTPGFTIGDVVSLLPFDEQRASMIATTEVTRTYAQSNQLAGRALALEFPGIKVIKGWFTNMDDRVCDVCGPLDGTEVSIEEDFQGLENPPAHPNCRCWTSVTTRAADNG